MSNQTRYFRLGLFLLLGGVLILAAAVIFGARNLTAEYLPAETYFTESVEGLAEGSPLKFRGVRIGQVSSVSFVGEVYHSAPLRQRQYVLVRMDIDKEVLRGLDMATFKRRTEGSGDDGLRVRLTTQGLTGVSYLEMDYRDPERNPVPPISWQPQSLYVPSAPSTMGRLEDAILNISKTLENIASIDFADLVTTVNNLLAQIEDSLQSANVASLGELLGKNLEESRRLLARVNTLVDAPETETILPDAAASMAALRRITENAEDDVQLAMQELSNTLGSIGRAGTSLSAVLDDPNFRQGVANLPEILENAKEASAAFGQSAERLSSLMNNLDETVIQERGDLEAILNNLRSLTANLDKLAQEAAANPSRILLGEPPRPGFPASAGPKEEQ